MVATRHSKTAALVTGGAGFLGQHLVHQLLDSGDYDVTIFDLHDAGIAGARTVRGDLSVAEEVKAACAGQDVVFHVATAAPTAAGARAQALMMRVNVTGTRNVLQACVATGVRRLVFTSTASVVFEGRDLVDVDESCPYATKPMDFYTGTKTEAERMVLAANSPALATCALRPSGIFGPGADRLLVPSIAERAKNGKLKYIIGTGENLFDWTYVGNVAAAHLLAAQRLAEPGSGAAGEAFFVTNDERHTFWGMLGDLAEGLGYERPSVKLPVWLMLVVAYLAAFFGALFGVKGDLNPTRVRLASVQRTVNVAKAKRVLGYKPAVSLEQGKELTIAGFQHLHRDAAAGEAQS